jgi:uncharacterized membrane-anchored protein YitT (DUF2179 family)
VAPARHSLLEDALAIITGTNLAALGVFILHSAGLVTGGTAGLSLLLGYAMDLPFGIIFLAVNLPFFVFAWIVRGRRFTLVSLLCVVLVSLLTGWETALIGPIEPNPYFAAIVGSLVSGTGVLVLFRHGGSVGGFNIIALVLQDKFGLRAGWTLLAFDAVVILSSFAVSSWPVVLGSTISAVVLNLVIALNHKPGRYTVGV